MKPEPDPQSDGKHAKPRRSFTKDNRVDDALEKDLWDLDEPEPTPTPAPEISEDDEEEEEPSTDETEKAAEGRTILPISPRSTRRDLVFKQSPPKKRPLTPAADEKPEEPRPTAEETADEFSNRITTSAASDKAFMDLENSPAGEPASKVRPEVTGKAAAADNGPSTGTVASAEASDDGTSENAEDAEDDAAAAPVPNPVKELSKGLSRTERMGLIGFLTLLAGGLIFFFAYTVNKLPDDRKPLKPEDLPIAGKTISADKIRSYWREPNASGGETVRRGTLLLPVVELGVSGGPGAVRILFRDSDGAIVGDGVTRPVNGEATVTIAATAGFDDQGMFAAYRMGETKPWKIEVYEGPSENAAGGDFKRLFEIPISNQRR